MSYQAVFVTGAPAAGKSTLVRELAPLVTPLKVVEYGTLLLERLRETLPDLTHDELRSRSAEVVSASSIANVDETLVRRLPAWLTETHVVIGSHAVTHEHYGVRVAPYTQRMLERLPLSAVVALYCPPQELLRRVADKPEGRRWRTHEEAERMQQLQISLAMMYGVLCGCPTYIVDTVDDPAALAQRVHDILVQADIFV